MYAVIETGGKQYRVVEGETLKVEMLDLGVGDSIDFDKVLMIGEGADVKIGKPYVKGGKVSAMVKSQGRHKKIEIIKFKRRQHYERRTGHRQYFTELEITGIAG